MNLEPLYKKTKTGAIQVCNISIEDDMFSVEFGQLDGKMQTQHTTCKPKNVGRANETSGAEQALSEAKAKHAKKIKSGYVLDESGESNIKLPMKVKVIQSQWKNIEYPCVSTPKLNGVNGTYRLENDKLNLYSRGGDIRPEIPHLEGHIRQILSLLETNEINVELYKHGEHLQDISSAVTKTNELSTLLKAYVFDFVDDGVDYEKRREKMMIASHSINRHYVSLLTGKICHTREDIERDYEDCMDLGLEGTVVKNLKGLYKHNERSSDQFKYKKALDAEFKVVGYEIDKNNHPVFICETNDKTFKVKPKGTDEKRLQMAKDADSYIGEWLKIEYETLSKDEIPLKPVGLTFRQCDADGNPIE